MAKSTLEVDLAANDSQGDRCVRRDEQRGAHEDISAAIAQWRAEKARESYEQTARVLERATAEAWPSSAIESIARIVEDHHEVFKRHRRQVQLLSRNPGSKVPSPLKSTGTRLEVHSTELGTKPHN